MGHFIREYSQIVSSLIIGICTLFGGLGAGMIVGDKLEQGAENIVVSVQGFDGVRDDRLLVAHNYGGRSGILLPEITIFAQNKNGERLDPLNVGLNEGTAGYNDPNPFMLHADNGRRYYLTHVNLPGQAAQCVLEYRVMQPNSNPRVGRTPLFGCTAD